ncbi:MAG: hypothetical protein U0V75_03645 [Ferruginibacter sp.]
MKIIFSLFTIALLQTTASAQVNIPQGAVSRPNPAVTAAAQKVKSAADMNETYQLEFTIMPMEGRKPLNLARENVMVNVLFTDGFYASAPLTNHGGKVFALTRVNRKLKDTAISHLEVIVNKNTPGDAADEWELFDLVVRCMAYPLSDPSRSFLWEERNFFPALQVIKPGQVVTSILKRPMQLQPAWLQEQYYATMLDAVFMIGSDDIKTNYRALDLKISTNTRRDEYYKSSVAGEGVLRNQLKGAHHLFSLNDEDWRKLNSFGRNWKNESGSSLPVSVKINEVAHLLLEYDFGDHGPLENDDWNLQGVCINVRLKENYGYRYYTNWQLNKKMTRNSILNIK